MAETTYYVSKEPFEEFVKRIEERFDHAEERADQRFLSLEKRMEQGFAYMEKARTEDFAHIEQRFNDLNQQMLDFRAEMRQMRNWLVRLYGLMVFSFIGAIVLILFRGLIFK